MCGIYGYLDRRGRPLPEEVTARMGKVIHHRGPDDCGAFAFDSGIIGNQRLSIIDLDHGHQPFVSKDGMIAVVQNGEIYNYLELRAELESQGVVFESQSDTEVLLRLYEREGMEFLSKLNGMFCFAVYDGRSDELFLARDRIGVKPLYLYDDGDRLIFGSEMKSILLTGIPRKVSQEALHHYFTFLFVPPPLTMFEGIHHLPPGHWMRVTRSGSDMHQWYDLAAFSSKPTPTIEVWGEEFRSLLKDGVRLRMRSDVPFGAFLSGGLDSSSVVHMMRQMSDHPVMTFSIGFDDPRFDESPYSEEVARMFGTDHLLEKVDPDMIGLWPTVVWHCDQPHSDVSYMPMYRLSELAVRRVKMVLTGDGGDELFGGYQRYADFFDQPDVNTWSDAEFATRYHDTMALLTESQKRMFYSDSLTVATNGLDSHAITAELFARASHHDRINQALYLDSTLLLAGNNLIKPDRMPMAVSLEARDPFLDPALVQFAFETPGTFKVKPNTPRWAYKKAVEPFLGEALTHRKKQMFTVPIGEWFKDRLRGWTYEVLLDDRTVERGLFRREAIEQMLDDHMAERANHTRLIRSFVALELWHRMFIDDIFESPPTMEQLGMPTPSPVTKLGTP
ncbi:MAG: asparagine synthase (glutamine-hydrolyzing) [Fimbriimonadaceae bacterium]|nr:asparagine synthase (glutamine-hydrolyzing) [Fimbriimonadaceae bacterium]